MTKLTVTIEDVFAAIVSETFTVLPDGRTTICQLTMKNGFTVTGESACVSKENFDSELGNKYAREAAIPKVWMMLGYDLCTKLSKKWGSTPYSRMVDEGTELEKKLGDLDKFMESEFFVNLNEAVRSCMYRQQQAMRDYLFALNYRMSIMKP
jgi:hypothetical protein